MPLTTAFHRRYTVYSRRQRRQPKSDAHAVVHVQRRPTSEAGGESVLPAGELPVPGGEHHHHHEQGRAGPAPRSSFVALLHHTQRYASVARLAGAAHRRSRCVKLFTRRYTSGSIRYLRRTPYNPPLKKATRLSATLREKSIPKCHVRDRITRAPSTWVSGTWIHPSCGRGKPIRRPIPRGRVPATTRISRPAGAHGRLCTIPSQATGPMRFRPRRVERSASTASLPRMGQPMSANRPTFGEGAASSILAMTIPPRLCPTRCTLSPPARSTWSASPLAASSNCPFREGYR